jgi:pantothenate kinase
MFEPDLKPNDYPPSIVKQLFADNLLSELYPSTHIDAAFKVLYKKYHRALQSFEQSQNCKSIVLPIWSNISHFQREKLCQVVVNAEKKKIRT